jgi:hypothetical protein
MKRLTGLALFVLLIGTTTTMLTANADTNAKIADREKWCRFGSVDGQVGHWTHHEVRATIACACRRWGVDFATALGIAERESGLNANAVNTAGSSASGVYQHIMAYWPGRIAAFNRNAPGMNAGPSVFNARSNVLVSIRMMARSGFSPWAATAP